MTAIAYPPEPTLTRRGLLIAGGAGVVGVALAELHPVVRLATALTDPRVPAHLRRSAFAGLVGDRFALDAASGRTVARLVAVDDLGTGTGGASTRAAASRDDAFVLVFHDPGLRRLEQDVMTLTHATLGRFRLLVSPAGIGRRGQDYAAVINRAPHPRRQGGTHVRAVPR